MYYVGYCFIFSFTTNQFISNIITVSSFILFPQYKHKHKYKHTQRGLWALDYLYGTIFMTYNLQIVELLPLPNKSGVQMLWRNPPGFKPKAGEYVKIQLPWLKHGGDEWHPFSLYLKESTQQGWKNVHNMEPRKNHLLATAKWEEGRADTVKLFVQQVLESEFETKVINTIGSAFAKEAREDLTSRSTTTQVFINPAGDWSKELVVEIEGQGQHRACWVRGPYTSPYYVAQTFSHLVLTATGIGITPALGVMGHFPGFSRTKVLVWSTRDANMLKFFAPLISDAHLAVIFYTGKEKLSDRSISKLESFGNIFVSVLYFSFTMK